MMLRSGNEWNWITPFMQCRKKRNLSALAYWAFSCYDRMIFGPHKRHFSIPNQHPPSRWSYSMSSLASLYCSFLQRLNRWVSLLRFPFQIRKWSMKDQRSFSYSKISFHISLSLRHFPTSRSARFPILQICPTFLLRPVRLLLNPLLLLHVIPLEERSSSCDVWPSEYVIKDQSSESKDQNFDIQMAPMAMNQRRNCSNAWWIATLTVKYSRE